METTGWIGAALVLGDGSSFTYAFGHSDIMGQAICVILFLASIATWTVMVEKVAGLHRLKKHNEIFIKKFREKRNPLGLMETAAETPVCPIAAVYFAACDKLRAFHLESQIGRRALNDAELELVKTTMEQTVEDQILLMEKKMTFLSTAVSGCPFLGLFGTVWGITIAFTNLAQLGRADINTLAPGVSGALLTTVIALIVAIPSLIGYNVVNANLRAMTVRLDNFVEEFHSRLKIEQMDSVNAAAQQ